MPRKANEKSVKTIPNAKRKLILMFVCIAIMIFTVTQTYYLARYTLGLEVSSRKMAVYNFILNLVTYEEEKDEEQDNLTYNGLSGEDYYEFL